MAAHRYRFLGKQVSPDQWVIDGDEHVHLTKVLRLEDGESVEVFDGDGNWAVGDLSGISKKQCNVAVREAGTQQLQKNPITIVMGAMRPQHMDEAIPSLIEVGVDRIWVFGQKGAEKFRTGGDAQVRWRRLAVSSAKQCKRSRLVTFEVLANLGEFLKKISDVDATRYVLDENGESLALGTGSAVKETFVVLGGEGGLSGDELAILVDQGFKKVSLGNHVLRAVTAGILAGGIFCLMRDLPPR